MCEYSIYNVKDKKKKMMENVTHVYVDGDKVNYRGMFGESGTMVGRILKVDSEKHEIYIG